MRTETRSLKNFVLSASKQLSAKVESVLNPIYTPGDTTPLIRRIKERIAAVVRKQPYAAQRDAVCALMQGYAHGARCLGLVAEMGCGKTLHSVLSAVSMELVTGHPIRTLVLCPPHLVSTWKEEIEESLGKAALVINASGPNALSLLIRLRSDARIPDKPEFWLISFNRAKTNYSWKSSFFKQTKLSSLVHAICTRQSCASTARKNCRTIWTGPEPSATGAPHAAIRSGDHQTREVMSMRRFCISKNTLTGIFI